MIKRHEVTGAGGVRLAAWEYTPEPAVAPEIPGVPIVPGVPVVPVVPEPADMPGRPGVLLLHGLLGRATHWVPTARRLAPRYRAVALDQRGHGGSGKPAGPYTPEAYTADAIATLEQLGLGPAVLIGHSTGALTAWRCAVARPDLVSAVVICDMRASALGEASQREWQDWLASWPVPFASLADARRWFSVFDPWAAPPNAVRGEFLAETLEEREDGWYPVQAPEHLLASREPWIRDAHWDELAQVGCPVLVVRGVDGELGRAEAQEMVRVLPRGHYAEIADAGHLVPWDQPEKWSRVLERFLRVVQAQGQKSCSARGR